MASSSSTQPATPDAWQNAFERGVAMALHLWPDMTLAVENNIGGGDSEDKRDWASGAVVDLFPTVADVLKAKRANEAAGTAATKRPAAAAAPPIPSAQDLVGDVEERLLDVMLTEFETAVQDDTAFDVAEQIVGLWTRCCKGDLAEVDALAARWQARKGKSVTAMFKKGDDADQDTDWDTDDGEDDDEDDEMEDCDDDDAKMYDAPQLVRVPREKTPPEVDEDGFTKVSRKKR